MPRDRPRPLTRLDTTRRGPAGLPAVTIDVLYDESDPASALRVLREAVAELEARVRRAP